MPDRARRPRPLPPRRLPAIPPWSAREHVQQLDRLGITVAARVPTGVHLSPLNGPYLVAKASRSHALELDLGGHRG